MTGLASELTESSDRPSSVSPDSFRSVDSPRKYGHIRVEVIAPTQERSSFGKHEAYRYAVLGAHPVASAHALARQ
jgi:hypothetical protein